LSLLLHRSSPILAMTNSSEGQASSELQLPGRVVRIQEVLNSGRAIRIVVALHVEHVEGIHIDPEEHLLRDWEDLEKRHVCRPVVGLCNTDFENGFNPGPGE